MLEYENPVLTGFYPDPSVCRVGNDYYMVNSTFEYLPGIAVFHSRDLINWKQIGHCITRQSQMSFPKAKASGGLYAPTIRYHNGTFYVVCTNTSKGNQGNFYVTAKDPYGEWSDPIWLLQDGIDPSLFFDDDGSVYLTSNGAGEVPGKSGLGSVIQQSKIRIETGEFETKPRIISYGTGGRCAEGPHLYKVNGWYYLILAEGGTETGHMVTVFRSDSPWGPFEPGPDNPVITARDENQAELSGTGHSDLFEDAGGNWWMVFLCFRVSSVKYHHLGRETALIPIAWEDGWPKAVDGKAPKRHVKVPGLTAVVQESAAGEWFCDDFTENRLGLKWNFLREYYDGYRLIPEKGTLMIHGRPQNLSDQDCPAFIGRRQCHMDMACEVSLLFEPEMEGEEAGISILCSNRAHYDLGVRRDSGKRVVQLHKTVEDMEVRTAHILPEHGEIVLRVEADRQWYHFFCMVNGEKIKLGSGMTKLLSTEVIWGFTGVYIGMYAAGNGMDMVSPAYFRKFRYEGRNV